MKKGSYIISLSILFVMGFLFLHSELDLFSPEQHVHTTHDFCDVVNGAKTETLSLDKSKAVNVDFCNMYIYTHILISTDTCYTIINPKKIKTNTNFNILYNTFLI